MAGQQTNSDRIVIASRFGEVAGPQNAIVHAAQAHGFSPSQIFAIKLSLEEAITNAIKHGNRLDESKNVTIEYEVSDDRLVVEIRDEGGGFTPDAVPDPTRPENLERPSGRGVMLMKAYMTEVAFSENGSCVRMVKRRDCNAPKDDSP